MGKRLGISPQLAHALGREAAAKLRDAMFDHGVVDLLILSSQLHCDACARNHDNLAAILGASTRPYSHDENDPSGKVTLHRYVRAARS